MNLKVAGAFTTPLKKHVDDRGYFQELYREDDKNYETLEGIIWKQINRSHSFAGTVRGIHRSPYSKLCTCSKGRIWDVVVDLRPVSQTYLTWDAVWLEPGINLYVPAYCGHGFFAAEESELLYFQGGIYDPEKDRNVHWRDPSLNIQWPEAKEYILSDKDKFAKNW